MAKGAGKPLFNATPLMLAASAGDDITALECEVIANRTDVAWLVIERGAEMNHVDKKGMTPLLYAASIDFGDAALVELLMKSGANPRATIKEEIGAGSSQTRGSRHKIHPTAIRLSVVRK